MISQHKVKRAMALASVIYPDTDCTPTEAQLARTLRLYRDREEFDGTYESAIECLTLAGYEVEGATDQGTYTD